jgi:hypothetical protein
VIHFPHREVIRDEGLFPGSSQAGGRLAGQTFSFLSADAFGRFLDDGCYGIRVRDIDGVAAGLVPGLGARALCHHSLGRHRLSLIFLAVTSLDTHSACLLNMYGNEVDMATR